MMYLENMFTARRLLEAEARTQEFGQRVRKSNMGMCTVTNPEVPLEERLRTLRHVLSLWEGDEFQTLNVTRQVPALMALLNITEKS
jgi:hypothetical protein